MTDLFLQIGLSNACVALALAIVAMVVGKTVKRPHLANLLWLLVLVKLVTPPLITIPVITIPGQADTAIATEDRARSELPVGGGSEFGMLRSAHRPAGGHEFGVSQPAAPLSAGIGSVALKHARGFLPPIWLLGSLVVLVWSLVRVRRFSRLLAAESQAAPQELQFAAVKIARRLGLNTIPTICTTSAHLSPMVWWTGGKVRVVIPTTLLDQLDAQQLKWVLSHELAHVRRRDYLVRWLEWLACVCFWWNPVVWWAQRNLRATEEICCDALVISALHPKPQSYAKSILTAVESLVRPAIRPPAMASEINSGGFLERRFKMIVSNNPNRSKSRWLQTCVLLCSVVVLPLGIASAQDYGAVERRLGESVAVGELTLKQAAAMMDALRKATREHREERQGRDKHERGGDERKKVEAHLRGISEKLQHAVREGKMSEEDARRKMEEVERGIRSRFEGRDKHERGGDERQKVEAHLREVREHLHHAVREGKMSEEDARRKMEEVERAVRSRFEGRDKHEHGGDKRKHHEQRERKEREERERHEQRERKERGRHEQREHSQDDRARAEAHIRGIWEKLQGAVRAGKMSEEDAHRKMGEIKKEIHSRFKDRDQHPRDGDKRAHGGDERARVDAHVRKIWEKLQQAVRDGKMSKEDAERKMGEIKREVYSRFKDRDERPRDGDNRHRGIR